MADVKISALPAASALTGTEVAPIVQSSTTVKATAQAIANLATIAGVSPLTTKGDMLGYSTVNARIPVGSNTQVLTADSTQALGLKWATPTAGTVTSVATDATLTGGPITSTGTLGINLANANTWTATQTINLNAAPAPTPISGSGIQVVGTDAAIARIEADSFGAIAAFSVRRTNGTGASPTAILSADQLGSFNFRGYYVTGGPGYSGVIASLSAVATQNWTSTNQGTKLTLGVTANNSTTMTTALTLDQDTSATFAAGIAATTGTFSGAVSGTTGTFSSTTSATLATLTGTPTASTSALLFNGAILTGGSGTTNFPHLFIQPTGTTAATTWSTSGTGIGLNLASGFAGFFLDCHIAGGVSLFNISPTGGINALGTSSMAAIASTSKINTSYAGAASLNALGTSGALFTGGTGTTNFPQFFQQPAAATAATTWSTSGTFHGINAASGFAGFFADYRVNGGSALYSISSAGLLACAGVTLADATNIATGTTTGSKIAAATNQKLSFWNATPIVQPTTGIAAATFVANTSGTVNDSATWANYTIGQVVQALRNVGILA